MPTTVGRSAVEIDDVLSAKVVARRRATHRIADLLDHVARLDEDIADLLDERCSATGSAWRERPLPRRQARE